MLIVFYVFLTLLIEEKYFVVEKKSYSRLFKFLNSNIFFFSSLKLKYEARAYLFLSTFGSVKYLHLPGFPSYTSVPLAACYFLLLLASFFYQIVFLNLLE